MNPISSSTSPSPSSLSSSTITAAATAAELAAAFLADGRFHQQYQQNISHHRTDHQQQKSTSQFIRSMTREFADQHHHHNHHYNHNRSQSLSNSSSSSSSSSSTMNENQLAMAAAHISLLQKYRQQQQQQQQQDQQNSVTSHQQLLNSMDHFSRIPRLAMNGDVGTVGCPTFATNLPSHHQPFPRLNQWMNDPFMSPPSTAALPPTKSSFSGDIQSLLSRRHSNGEDLMDPNDDLLLNIQQQHANMLEPALFYGPTTTAPASHYYHGIGSTGISSPYSSGPTTQPCSISSFASMTPPSSVKSSSSAASQRPNLSSASSMFNNSNQQKMATVTPNKNNHEQQSPLTSPLSSATMAKYHDLNSSFYSGSMTATMANQTNHNQFMNTIPVMQKQKQLPDPSPTSSSLLFNIKHEETSCNSPYPFGQKPQQVSNLNDINDTNSSSEYLNQTKSQSKTFQQSMANRSIKRSPSLEAINQPQQCDESIMHQQRFQQRDLVSRLPPFSSIAANNHNHLTLANNNLPFDDPQHQQHKPYPYSMNVSESDADDYSMGTQNNRNQTILPSNNPMVQRQSRHRFNNNNNNSNNLSSLSTYLDEMAKMTARHHPESKQPSLNSSSSLLLAAAANQQQQRPSSSSFPYQYHQNCGDPTSLAASLSNQSHHHNPRSKFDHGSEVSLLFKHQKQRGRPKKNSSLNSNSDSSIASPTTLESFNGQSLPSISTFFDSTTSPSFSNLVLNSPPPFTPHCRPTTSSRRNFDFDQRANNVPAFPGVPDVYSVPACKEYSANPKRLSSDPVQHLPLASHHPIQQLPKLTNGGKRPRGRPKMNDPSDQINKPKHPKSSLASEASWSALQSSLASILPGFNTNSVAPVMKRGRGRPKSLKTILKEVQSAGHQIPQEMIQTLLANQSKIPRSNQQQHKDKQHSGFGFYDHQRLPPSPPPPLPPPQTIQPKFHQATDDNLLRITDAARYDNCPEPQPGLAPSSPHHHHHRHHHSHPHQNQPTPSYHHSPIGNSYYPEMAALSSPPSLIPSAKFCSPVPSLLPPALLSPEKPKPKLPSCGAIYGETEIVKNPFDDLDELNHKPNRISQPLSQNGYSPMVIPPSIENDCVPIPVRSQTEQPEIAQQQQQLVAPIRITLNDSTFRCTTIVPNETRIPKKTESVEKIQSLGPTSRIPIESSPTEDDNNEDVTDYEDATSSYSVPSFLEDTSDDDYYDDDWLNGYGSSKTKRQKLQNPTKEDGCNVGGSNQSAEGSGTLIDLRPRSSQIHKKTDQKQKRTRQSLRSSGKPMFTETLMLQTLNQSRSLYETDSCLNKNKYDDLCDYNSYENSNHLHDNNIDDDKVDSRFETKDVETKEFSEEISPVYNPTEQPSEVDLPKLPKLKLKRLDSDSGQTNLFKIIQPESGMDIDNNDVVLGQPEQNENEWPTKESSPPLITQSNSCDELVNKKDLVAVPVISEPVDLVPPQPNINDNPELIIETVPEKCQTSIESDSIERIPPIEDVIPIEGPLENTNDDSHLFRTPSPPPAFDQHTGISAIFPDNQSLSSSHPHQRSTLDSLMPINGLINSFANENKLISDNEQFSAINSIMNFDDDQSTDQPDAIELNPLISQVSIDLAPFANDDEVAVEEPESTEQIENVQETGFTKEEILGEMMASTIITAEDKPGEKQEKEIKNETIPNNQDSTNNEESENNLPETEKDDFKQEDSIPSPIKSSSVNDDVEKFDELLQTLQRHSPLPEEEMEQKSPQSITLLSPCDPNGLSSSATNSMLAEHQDSIAEPFAAFPPQTILPVPTMFVPNQNQTNPILSSHIPDGNEKNSIQTSPTIIAQTITSTPMGFANPSNPITVINQTTNLMPTFQSNQQPNNITNTVPIMKPVNPSHLEIAGNFLNQAPRQPQIPAPVPSVQIYSNFVQQQQPQQPPPPPQQHRFPIMLPPNAAIRFLGPNGQPIHPGISNPTPMMPQHHHQIRPQQPQAILVSNPQSYPARFHQIGSQQPFMFRSPHGPQLHQPHSSQPMIASQSANGSMINFILPNQPGLIRSGSPANPSSAANINPIFIRHGQRLIPMNPSQLLNLRMLNQNQTLFMSPSPAPAPPQPPSIPGTSSNIFQAQNIIPQAQFASTPLMQSQPPIPTKKIILEAKQPILIREKLPGNTPLKTDEFCSQQPKDILTAAMEEISFDDLDDNHPESAPVSDNHNNANRNPIPTAPPTMMVFNNLHNNSTNSSMVRIPMVSPPFSAQFSSKILSNQVQMISTNNLVPTPALHHTVSNNRIPPSSNPVQANPPANNVQLTNDDLDRLFSDDLGFSEHFDEDFKFFDEIGESIPSQTNSSPEILVEPKIKPSLKHHESIDQTQKLSEEPSSDLITPIVQQMLDEVISKNDNPSISSEDPILPCDKSDSNSIQNVSGIIADLLENLSEPENELDNEEKEIKMELEIEITEPSRVLSLVDYDSDDSAEAIGLATKDEEIETGLSNQLVEKIEKISRIQTNVCRSEPILTLAKLFSWDLVKPFVPEDSLLKVNSHQNEINKIEPTCEDIVKKLIDSTISGNNDQIVSSDYFSEEKHSNTMEMEENRLLEKRIGDRPENDQLDRNKDDELPCEPSNHSCSIVEESIKDFEFPFQIKGQKSQNQQYNFASLYTSPPLLSIISEKLPRIHSKSLCMADDISEQCSTKAIEKDVQHPDISSSVDDEQPNGYDCVQDEKTSSACCIHHHHHHHHHYPTSECAQLSPKECHQSPNNDEKDSTEDSIIATSVPNKFEQSQKHKIRLAKTSATTVSINFNTEIVLNSNAKNATTTIIHINRNGNNMSEDESSKIDEPDHDDGIENPGTTDDSS